MTIEYAAVAVGTFLIIVILIWKKLRTIDMRLREMQAELNELHAVESRLFIMALNANPKAQAPKAEPTIASAQSNDGRIIAEDDLGCSPQSPNLDVGTSRAEGDELCARLITLVPPAEAIPLISGQEAETHEGHVEGRRLLQAWPVHKPSSG
jgi:hypothetical protein